MNAVTHYDNFLQQLAVFCQFYVDFGLSAYGNLLCLISDIGEYESCVCRNIGKGVVSVNVCDTSVTCSFHLDRSTNHRT